MSASPVLSLYAFLRLFGPRLHKTPPALFLGLMFLISQAASAAT
jgi:hypothetical protein